LVQHFGGVHGARRCSIRRHPDSQLPKQCVHRGRMPDTACQHNDLAVQVVGLDGAGGAGRLCQDELPPRLRPGRG